MKRRTWIILLCLIGILSLSLFVACSNSTGGNGGDGDGMKDYTFEDYVPENLAQPDEGFTIDGILDEEVYSTQNWFRGVKVEKDDGNLNYATALEDLDGAATFAMTTYFGENGIYVAIEYKAGEGESLYVNNDRSSTQNSITELYFAPPQATDIKDITVCEIDMGPDGSLNFKKNNSNGYWENFATTNDIMAQLGTQKNGVVGEFVPEGQQRATEYTMELFIPWGYVDKIAGEGTADVIKNGGEIYLNAAPITSYNYLGTDGDVDRWWWMIGSQLDDGSWGNTRGWYHFDENGLVAYDIEIETTGDGVVMERMNYDFAVANNSVTFLTHPADGCALTEITVNGKSYSDSVAFVGDGYFVVPASEVTKDLKVVAVFDTYDPTPQDFEATVSALYYGTTLNLEGAQLLLDGANDYTLDISGGKVSGEIPYGTYTVSLVGDDFANYDSQTYIFRNDQVADFQFSYNVFTANMIYGKGGAIDNTHSNDAQNAYVSNVSAGQMWAVMTDETTDGVFTVNVQSSDAVNNGNIYIAYILDGSKVVVFQVRLEEDEFFVQWRIWLSDFGINGSNILSPSDWTSASLSEFTDAYNGDGVDVTLVREGSAYYVFASEHGKPETAKLALQCTVSASYAETLGNWAFGGANIASNAKFEIDIGTDEEDVNEWMNKIRATIIDETEETEHGTLEISSSVITIKPEEGYILNTITVNGEDRMPDVDKDTNTLVLKTSAGETYKVKATFREEDPPVSVSITVTASNVNDQDVVVGKTLVLENTWYRYKYTIGTGGVVTASVAPGTYTATILESGSFEAEENVTISADTPVTINLTYTAFTANLIFGNDSGPIDISNAYDTSGSIKNLEEGRMWAVKNDTNLDFAFTVTVQASDIGENMLLAFIIDGKVVVLQVKKDNSGNFRIEWRDWMADFNVHTLLSPTDWSGKADGSLNDAFAGDGVDVTFVRDGDHFYVFAYAHGASADTATLFAECTISGDYAATAGNLVIGSHKAPAGAEFEYSLSDEADTIASWVEKANA